MDYNFETVFFVSSSYLFFALQGRKAWAQRVSRQKIFVILFPFLAFYPSFATVEPFLQALRVSTRYVFLTNNIDKSI